MKTLKTLKHIALLVGMLLMSFVSVGQNELTVHDGTTTNSYVPFYGLWVDDYTRTEIIYPANELSAMTGGTINSITFYKNSTNTNSWGAASFRIHLKEVTETSLSNYITIDDATLVYSGTIDASGGERTVTITFNTPYQYNGGNLLFSVYQTTEGSYSSASWYGEDVTGKSASGYNSSNASSASFNQRSFIPKTTFTYISNSISSSIMVCGETYTGTLGTSGIWDSYTDGSWNEPGEEYVYIFTPDITGNYIFYTTNDDGDADFFVMEEFSNTSNSLGCWSIDDKNFVLTGGNTYYIIVDNYYDDESASYTIRVECPIICNPPENIEVTNITGNSAELSWNNNGYNINIRTNCKRYNFDTGFQGWTTIDADGDGYDWVLGSNVGGIYLVDGASLSGEGHNSSIDLVTSGSYENVNTSALTPDNYLVSPLMQFGSGSKISFWACAQDNNYQSEHFGIAISTNGNINPEDFTTIAYCTFPGNMTRAQSSWKYYEVDLSSYSGQGYVAIRHFDCSDEFMLNIDDITICENGSILIENVTSPYIITNLSPETEYTYLIESDCGNDYISELYSITFTTGDLCNPIGTGDEANQYLPTYSFYNYSLTQQIYTSDEIGNAEPSQATTISFYNNIHNTPKTRTIDIYLQNTNKSSFSSTSDWVPVSSTDKVFSGTVTFAAEEWIDIQLNMPFEYTGNNIIVTIDDNSGNYTGSPHMQCKVYNANGNQTIRIYSDGINYDPINNPTYSGTLMTVKNQIKLCTEEGWTLPISLLEFYATPDHLTPTPTNNIYIKTGGEWNNCEYIIYRSPDAINWDYDNPVIDWDFSDNPHDASTNANYSENSYMEYYPIDFEPYDTTYYKLIQRDCDNTAHEYTSEIIVCINTHQKKSAWDYFTHTYEGLQVNSSDSPIEIRCHDVLGRLIYTYSLPSHSNTIISLNPPFFVTVYENGVPKATEKVFR